MVRNEQQTAPVMNPVTDGIALRVGEPWGFRGPWPPNPKYIKIYGTQNFQWFRDAKVGPAKDKSPY